jgi:hypothetical protein
VFRACADEDSSGRSPGPSPDKKRANVAVTAVRFSRLGTLELLCWYHHRDDAKTRAAQPEHRDWRTTRSFVGAPGPDARTQHVCGKPRLLQHARFARIRRPTRPIQDRARMSRGRRMIALVTISLVTLVAFVGSAHAAVPLNCGGFDERTATDKLPRPGVVARIDLGADIFGYFESTIDNAGHLEPSSSRASTHRSPSWRRGRTGPAAPVPRSRAMPGQ